MRVKKGDANLCTGGESWTGLRNTADQDCWHPHSGPPLFFICCLVPCFINSAESGVDPDFMPSEEGMDTLCISGSAQFSVPQFRELASSLRECAGDRTVYVFDLRQESHGLVNEGIPLSWYGTHNWANEGMTLEEVEADESERLGAMIGSTIEAYARKGETPIEPPMLISVESVMTEKELVESEGFEYIRLPIRDHSWPTAETIDTFVSFVKSIDPDQSWLHFHCLGGRGRTGVLMMIYDIS